MSDKKIIISPTIGLAILAIIGVIGIAISSNNSSKVTTTSQTASSGVLVASEISWDIGDVSMANGIHTKTVELTNPSNEPITITEMETSCMCTKATIVHEDGSRSQPKGMRGHGGSTTLSETIAPGETASIQVAYDPNAHGPDAVGPIKRTVQLMTTSQTQPMIKLNFSGVVTK